MITPKKPSPSLPEDEDMDPVGKTYPEQESESEYSTDTKISPEHEPIIPIDPEYDRVRQPDSS